MNVKTDKTADTSDKRVYYTGWRKKNVLNIRMRYAASY